LQSVRVRAAAPLSGLRAPRSEAAETSLREASVGADSPRPVSPLALGIAALLGPFWSTAAPGAASATVGRCLLAGVALALAVDLIRRRDRSRLVIRAVWPLFAAVAGLLAWIALNAATWGCNCAGSLGGVAELGMACVLAAAVCTLDPPRGPAILMCAAAGVGVGALLAAAGLKDLNSALVGPEDLDDRLDGVYGNANFLAYALAFSLPTLVASVFWSRRVVRAAAVAGLAAVAALLALTFSRGGILAATLGGFAAAGLAAPPGRRSKLVAAVALLAFVAAGALIYPLFAEQRTQANFGQAPQASGALQDRSGWDPRAQGVIPEGDASLSNDGSEVLTVSTTTPGQGASYPIGAVEANDPLVLTFEARSQRDRLDLSYALEDNLRGNGPVVRRTPVSSEWKSLRLRWRPTATSPEARIYFWQTTGASAFQLRNVRVRAPEDGAGGRDIPVAMQLAGPPSATSEKQGFEREEERYIESRLAGLELSASAFLEHPVRGIGWERFPEFAQQREEFGRLPTHNEYARILAELGLVGVALFVALVAVVITGGLTRRDRRLRVIGAGMLVTGGVGLLFVNGLAISSASLPLALAAGALASRGSDAGAPFSTPPDVSGSA
jgi:hypothetical protein